MTDREFSNGAIDETLIIDKMHLEEDVCVINGKKFSAHIGYWAFYIPELQFKFLHAVDGKQFCIHAYKRLERQKGIRGLKRRIRSYIRRLTRPPTYTELEWANALSKPATRRVAENLVASERLAKSGIGPVVGCPIYVKSFSSWYAPTVGTTAGYKVQSAFELREKQDATLQDLQKAGVQPDKTLSCVGQQLNGYVTDLNSVVGVMPIGDNAEEEIKRYEHSFQKFTR